jgi:hypothetical protein
MLKSVWQDFIKVDSSKCGDLLSSINIALSIFYQTLDNGRFYAGGGMMELMNTTIKKATRSAPKLVTRSVHTVRCGYHAAGI